MRARISARLYRWNESPSTTCALMPSRRKMCWKLCITVLVPAPDDPVTAMIGCFLDNGVLPRCALLCGAAASGPRFRPVQGPLVEERRDVRLVGALVVLAVVALDAVDLVLRPEHEADALVQLLRLHFQHRRPPRARAPARLLHHEADGVRLVQQAQPPRLAH